MTEEKQPEGFTHCPRCGAPIAGYSLGKRPRPLDVAGGRHTCELASWKGYWVKRARESRANARP
jgi:hypothetical protein